MEPLKNLQFIRNKWLILILLMLAYTFSFMDRYVINLLVDPIKEDMHISDTQVSALLGISFAFFYAILGIPLGRLADTHNRKNVIGTGIFVWSIMTALCGSAKNFMHLFLARMGVGIGEATLSPASYSLITNCFPSRLWATAISIYSLGIYLGSGIAYIVGGKLILIFSQYHKITLPIIGDILGWQLVFFLFGLPGIIIALLFSMVEEPKRKSDKVNKNELGDFFQWIKDEGKLYLLLCFGTAVFNIAVYATATWLPTFLKRVHHLNVSEAGLILGLSTLLLPSIGIVVGGKIADNYAVTEGLKGRLKILLYTTLIFIPSNFFFPFTHGLQSTILAMIPHGLLISASVGMGIACIQETVPSHYRGIASGVLLFTQNLIGMGLGPLCVGLMNDYVFHDSLAIGKSLMFVSVISLIIAALLFTKALFVKHDLKIIQR